MLYRYQCEDCGSVIEIESEYGQASDPDWSPPSDTECDVCGSLAKRAFGNLSMLVQGEDKKEGINNKRTNVLMIDFLLNIVWWTFIAFSSLFIVSLFAYFVAKMATLGYRKAMKVELEEEVSKEKNNGKK